MFFRRHRPKPVTFEDRMLALERLGFSVRPDGAGTRVERDGCAAFLGRTPDGAAAILERPGIVIGGENGVLVDGGYQKFLETPSGRRKPALASELKALHRFSEDLREGLGLVSLYNESLGTTSKLYLYDRVEDRDVGVKRIWD
jgi:hypothetical protein